MIFQLDPYFRGGVDLQRSVDISSFPLYYLMDVFRSSLQEKLLRKIFLLIPYSLIWLTDLKGGESDYSLENRKRGAKMRLYKTDFLLKYINIYLLDKESIDKQHLFQKGMRNSNGKPRRDKLSIDLTTITPVKRIFF